MFFDTITTMGDPLTSIIVIAVIALVGLLLLKFVLRLAWRLLTMGCIVIAFLVLAAALGVHFFK